MASSRNATPWCALQDFVYKRVASVKTLPKRLLLPSSSSKYLKDTHHEKEINKEKQIPFPVYVFTRTVNHFKADHSSDSKTLETVHTRKAYVVLRSTRPQATSVGLF